MPGRWILTDLGENLANKGGEEWLRTTARTAAVLDNAAKPVDFEREVRRASALIRSRCPARGGSGRKRRPISPATAGRPHGLAVLAKRTEPGRHTSRQTVDGPGRTLPSGQPGLRFQPGNRRRLPWPGQYGAVRIEHQFVSPGRRREAERGLLAIGKNPPQQ